jgi:hypothetical protein
MPLWTVQGVVTKYLQTDDYSCGALAINQFAKILRELSNGTILGDGIDEFLDFKDTSDENIDNAKSLLLQLMEKRFSNCFELMTDGGHVWNENQVVVPPTDETHENEEVEAAQVISSLREKSTEVVDRKDDKKSSKRKQVQQEQNGDKRKKGTNSPPSEAGADVQIRCKAGLLCLVPDEIIVLQGDGLNASLCSECKHPFHHACLFVSDGVVYCSQCFKKCVVSQCSTETLFKDLFDDHDWATSTGNPPTHRSKELRTYVSNHLGNIGFAMTLADFEKWKTKLENDERDARKNSHRLTKKQKANREQVLRYYQFQKERYEREIINATNEWVLSMDGVVKGLRYRKEDKKFVAQYHYLQKAGTIKKEGIIMTVTNNWVFDTLGKRTL